MYQGKLKDAMATGMYAVGIIVMLTFLALVTSVDWQGWTSDLNDALEEMSEMYTCEVKTETIYYKGMCSVEIQEAVANEIQYPDFAVEVEVEKEADMQNIKKIPMTEKEIIEMWETKDTMWNQDLQENGVWVHEYDLEQVFDLVDRCQR